MIARFYAIVHHTDADREWAYDRKSDGWTKPWTKPKLTAGPSST